MAGKEVVFFSVASPAFNTTRRADCPRFRWSNERERMILPVKCQTMIDRIIGLGRLESEIRMKKSPI
jgi:hypothetical protein